MTRDAIPTETTHHLILVSLKRKLAFPNAVTQRPSRLGAREDAVREMASVMNYFLASDQGKVGVHFSRPSIISKHCVGTAVN